MNGILNILKPPGMTSFDVVGYLRSILRIKKIGHTGTLDPGAVGVLPVCVGSATKVIEYITEKDKVYRAEMTLGSSTDTQDSSGTVLETREVNVSPEDVEKVIKEFEGKIRQIPPMYSAVKVDGRKLYELARSGITVERKPRDIEIYSIDIVKNIRNNDENRANKVILDVHCSKGTYIRTLCHDIGERLGCGGHMSFLVRLKSGNFDISSAVTLREISELYNEGRLVEKFIRTDEVFLNLDKLVLNIWDLKKFLNGVLIQIDGQSVSQGDVLRIYDEKEAFIAVGEVLLKNGNLMLKSKKVF